MTSNHHQGVLRDVSLHAQPRRLDRPRLVGPEPLHGASPPQDSIGTRPAQPQIDADARDHGHRHIDAAAHAEGFARGHAEGQLAGFMEGTADAQSHLDEAVRSTRARLEAEAVRQTTGARAAQAAIVERLGQVEQGFRQAAAARLQALENDVVALAYEAVCQIIGDRAGLAERLAGVVGIALGKLGTAELCRVRVNPADLELLRTSSVAPIRPGASACVEWIGDGTVGPGGCMLDTDRGSIDARMETQLARLRDVWSAAGRTPATAAPGPEGRPALMADPAASRRATTPAARPEAS